MMVNDDKKIEERLTDISKPTGILMPKSGDSTVISYEYQKIEKQKPSLLLHSCCGPCSTAVVERLVRDFKISIFFCNSNIDDSDEYEKRLSAQKDFVNSYNSSPSCVDTITLIVGRYNPQEFLQKIKGRENDPEGGKRCAICMASRLEQTADFASLNGFECFTTTLSVSPHKNNELISSIGKDLMLRYGVFFLAEDFKKKDGYKRSVELSKAYGLYRQNFCGCSFSKKEAMNRNGLK